MKFSFDKIKSGYSSFREKYVLGEESIMKTLSIRGQRPQIMVIACCDSRVDPALILQCDPGDLFVMRNVANIVPRYCKDNGHHGTSAALEFGVRVLGVSHIIILGHSQCGGINALLNQSQPPNNDFIENWVSQISTISSTYKDSDTLAKHALNESFANCLTFPWLRNAMHMNQLCIHRWFFDISKGEIFTYSDANKDYLPL